MRDFLIGQINRLKNYTRWSWEWYKVNPYRNTLVAVLLFVILFRQPVAAPAVEQQHASAPPSAVAPEVITVPVIVPINTKHATKETKDAEPPRNIREVVAEFRRLEREYFQDIADDKVEQQTQMIVDRASDVRDELRRAGIDAEYDPKQYLSTEQVIFVRKKLLPELLEIGQQADQNVALLRAREQASLVRKSRLIELTDILKNNVDLLPEPKSDWVKFGYNKLEKPDPIIVEQAWRSYNRTVNLLPKANRITMKLPLKELTPIEK